MKYGHFDDPNFEYVIDRPDTPTSWTNYLGTKKFGSIITNNAGGYSFVNSPALGRFTRMNFNAVKLDQPGKYFYIRDNESGDFWSSSWQPVNKSLDEYKSECRFGTGYARITSDYSDIKSESTYFIPLDQNFEYWTLRLTNTGDKPRKLSVQTYCEFAGEWNILQDSFNRQYSAYCVRGRMEDNGILQCTSLEHLPEDPENFKNGDQSRWTWMSLSGGEISGYECDREAFIGDAYRDYSNPVSIESGKSSNSRAYGANACGSIKTDIELAPGETREIVVLLGIGHADSTGEEVRAEFGTMERAEIELQKIKDHWHTKLKVLQVETPDEDFNHMINVWNAYNCHVTFGWSRSAGLIYSGYERDGLGYRDTVQDFMGVMHSAPQEAREMIELMLSAQESNGGGMPEVQPFAHYPGKMPKIDPMKQRSDDCIWHFNAIPEYVKETGDFDFYNKVVPFSDEGEATVYEHLKRALEFNLERSGKHGLPCGLFADWDDGFRLGFNGETVMLAFQIRMAWSVLAEVAEKLGKADDAQWAIEQLKTLDDNIQKHCWDGKWFIRAFREKGDKLGAAECEEGFIFRPPQSWAVMSGAATEEQAKVCLDSVDEHLATDYGLMALAPPYTQADCNEIRCVLFPPGQKENGGIFSHSQGWTVMANCMIGEGDRAYKYYRAFMPSRYNEIAELRRVEPYVHCQTTDSKYSEKEGESHLPWLTGAATWAYFSAAQYILGIRPEDDGLRIDPCIPSDWPSFTATRIFRGKTISIEVKNPNGLNKGIVKTTLNGEMLADNLIPEEKLQDENNVICELG